MYKEIILRYLTSPDINRW